MRPRDIDAIKTNDHLGAGVPLGILSVYEPLGGIICANLPFLYHHATGMFKKLISSFGPSQTGPTVPGTGATKPQYSMWKRKQNLSQSERDRLQRDTDKDVSASMSERRESQATDIELEMERSKSMPHEYLTRSEL